VDFRELVKDLVSIFKTRIELRQIGVRDEARVVGGLGVCGRCYCCHAVSDKLKPVSIKMAKDQNLSLNSMKISGPCGRLLCCRAYEHNFYSETRRQIPQEGARINYEDTAWRVMEVNIVMGQLKLSSEDGRILTVPAASFEKVEGHWRITKIPELAGEKTERE
jgi:cell fate regulator YaaT (PSP1 superfamily)